MFFFFIERKAEKILIETGETTGFDENFGISDLQPVEETDSFSPNVPEIQNAPSAESPSSESPAKKTAEMGAVAAGLVYFVIADTALQKKCLLILLILDNLANSLSL